MRCLGTYPGERRPHSDVSRFSTRCSKYVLNQGKSITSLTHPKPPSRAVTRTGHSSIQQKQSMASEVPYTEFMGLLLVLHTDLSMIVNKESVSAPDWKCIRYLAGDVLRKLVSGGVFRSCWPNANSSEAVCDFCKTAHEQTLITQASQRIWVSSNCSTDGKRRKLTRVGKNHE